MKLQRHIYHITVLFFFIFTLSASAAEFSLAPKNFYPIVQQTSQNALDYLDPRTADRPLLTAEEQQLQAQKYLRHYYLPWLPRGIEISSGAIEEALAIQRQYWHDPGWGEDHYHPHTQQWIRAIIRNANLRYSPSQHTKAITLKDTYLRGLPTATPSYSSWTKAGEGYPFDYLQLSLLAANTPILILHTSQDGIWSLVLAGEGSGWVRTKNIAPIDANAQAMLQNGNFVTVIKDRVPVMDAQQQIYFSARIGTIYPLARQVNGIAVILIAVANPDRKATVIQAALPTMVTRPWPLQAATPRTMANLANQLIGEPYGWGGLDGHRDCSATTRDLLAAIGIWLPRNSRQQLKVANPVAIRGLDNFHKEQRLIKYGVPWLTLTGYPGHVMLYIGTRSGQAYVLHNKWGVETRDASGKEGRAIIAHAAITPVTLGAGYRDVPRNLLNIISVFTVVK